MEIQNPFFNYIFNTFDTPVRFLYTNAGPISTLGSNLMFWKLYKSDFVDLQNKFEEMNDFLNEYNVSLTN